VFEKLCNQPSLRFLVQSPLWEAVSRIDIEMKYKSERYSNHQRRFLFNRLDRNPAPVAVWDDDYFVSDDVDDPLWDLRDTPTIRLWMRYEVWLDPIASGSGSSSDSSSNSAGSSEEDD